jgi:hypothetical protein
MVLIGVVFALAPWLAGPKEPRAMASDRELRNRVVELESENRALAEKIARLEMDDKVDREAYRQVEQQLAELQGTIIEQQEDLAFYRGLVAGPGRGPLRIRRAVVLPGPKPSSYRLRLVLSQGEQAESIVRGEVHFRVEGNRGAAQTSLNQLELGAPRKLRFSFRYFQDLEADLVLPPDFKPARLVVSVMPSMPGTAPTVESYSWAMATG